MAVYEINEAQNNANKVNNNKDLVAGYASQQVEETLQKESAKAVEKTSKAESAVRLGEDNKVQSSEEFIFFGAEALEVFDVVGAGDMVISILAMLISSKATPAVAAHWAQLGAAMEIQHVGVVSFDREEIRKRFVYGHISTKIVSLKRLQKEVAQKDKPPLVITKDELQRFLDCLQCYPAS